MPQRKKCGDDLSHRTHFLCPECPLTFPEPLFIWGCVGCERSLLNHSIYEWRETKTAGYVLGSHAMSTGRKLSVELPERQAGKSTQEDRLGEVAKMGSEPLPPPICLSTLGPKEGTLLFGSILARETQKLHKAE